MKKKSENKKTQTYIYKPIQRTDEKWQVMNVSDTCRATIPTPNFFIENNLLQKIHFGKFEVEEAARILVEFLATKKDWVSFSFGELNEFCIKNGKGDAGNALFGLICPWWDDGGLGIYQKPYPCLVQIDQKLFVTTTFIKHLMPNGITQEMLKESSQFAAKPPT